MTKKTRLIILSICVLLFLIITPCLIFYSLGYRFDYKNKKIFATGGIYVASQTSGANILIDSKEGQRIGLFSDFIFVQNLKPGIHNVVAQKQGFFEYKKELPVKENIVTKLENILLIKEKYQFNNIENNVDYFLISPDQKSAIVSANTTLQIFNLADLQTKKEIALPIKNYNLLQAQWSDDSQKVLLKLNYQNTVNYYSYSVAQNQATLIKFLDKNSTNINFGQQNTNQIFFVKNNQLLYSSIIESGSTINQPTLIAKNIADYKIINNNIVYFDLSGSFYRFDIANNLNEKITNTPLLINKTATYKLFYFNENVFVSENQKLFKLNLTTKLFEKFADNANNVKMSPNWKNILYYNSSQIYNYNLESSSYLQAEQKTLLGKYNEVANCFWLNNDYLVITFKNSVKISELDSRGNINVVNLPISLIVKEKSIASEDMTIFYNSQNKKLYILAQKNLFESEKIY